MEKTFETISELVKDEVFINQVSLKLKELCNSRLKRPEPKPGYRYKRDWYDRMRDEGQLNSPFFTSHIEDIWNKRSNLNSETRNIIQYICDHALVETNEFYTQLDSKSALKKSRKGKSIKSSQPC